MAVTLISVYSVRHRPKGKVNTMTTDNQLVLAGGAVHDIPTDVAAALETDDALIEIWQGLTPLARNEWICWVEDAKKPETRTKRKALLTVQLLAGKRRPCC